MDSLGAFGRYYRVDAADVLDICLICLYAEETSFLGQHSVHTKTRQLIFLVNASYRCGYYTLLFYYIGTR